MSITTAAAALADRIGLSQLSMSLVADHLSVRAPSLYKHVDGLRDLTHRVAILAATEVGDGLRDAMQGRASSDALAAAAQTLRAYVTRHPGRYAAMIGVRPTGADDPLTTALERAVASFAAVLRGYRLDPADEIHALRMLRSILHGFAILEVSDAFKLEAAVADSFSWMVDFIDRGLCAVETP